MTKRASQSKSALLFEQADWDFDALRRTYDAIEQVARHDLGLDVYPNQIEIISSEQMLDAYSSIGMPLMYHHWSFGKHFLSHERLYRKGARGLAYEIVINSDPCISYCLEENTMPLQALVMAHAAFGHNHFFKSNHLFRQWTDAEGILDYLDYARRYIAHCEERHGVEEVEMVLDAAHALMPSGVFRHHRPRQPSLREAEEQRQQRRAAAEQNAYYLWNTIPNRPDGGQEEKAAMLERKREMRLPEENLLYFLEHYSPILESWQREVLRIVRNVGQYFYPQKQTKVMNEGCACFVHYHILTALYAEGRLSDGAMLEILHNHTNVLSQPAFDDPQYLGINPYALGFAMMQDIRRICEEPDEEDCEWFPDIAGKGDWRNVLKHAWANYRDESFIQQFLSPTVMRRFRMFVLSDDVDDPYLNVTGIHDERGYRHLRDTLASNHDISTSEPDIQIVDADLLGDRCLHMRAVRRAGIPLDTADRDATLRHIERLWGYKVEIKEVESTH